MLLPAGTPPETVARLEAALARIVRAPLTQDKFARIGALPRASTTPEFEAFLSAEYRRWGEAIARSGIKAD